MTISNARFTGGQPGSFGALFGQVLSALESSGKCREWPNQEDELTLVMAR